MHLLIRFTLALSYFEVEMTVSYLMVTIGVQGSTCSTFKYKSGLVSKNKVNARKEMDLNNLISEFNRFVYKSQRFMYNFPTL